MLHGKLQASIQNASNEKTTTAGGRNTAKAVCVHKLRAKLEMRGKA